MNSRVSGHFRVLRKGEHPSHQLQANWDKHGERAIKFDVLELCPEKDLDKRESFWIEMIGTYNRLPGGRDNIRFVNSDPEVRRKRSMRAKQQHKDGSLHSYFTSESGRCAGAKGLKAQAKFSAERKRERYEKAKRNRRWVYNVWTGELQERHRD